MCGILGMVTVAGHSPPIDDDRLAQLRDLMTHRGPDAAGLWRARHAALAHRRLAVLDPSPAGAQPMLSPDGLHALVYNGELYNDADLRLQLASKGVRFRTNCDTETVLHALIAWGPDALRRFRGMFALAFVNLADNSLLLARDPLGIKPLYWWSGSEQGLPALLFASEIAPIVRWLGPRAAPDWPVVSAYLTTIRTTLGDRTLYAGVRTLPPGGVIHFDLSAHAPRPTFSSLPVQDPLGSPPQPDDDPDPAALVRRRVSESVRAHLRSDVPVCSLLSGGLDSTIIAAQARDAIPALTTFASGAPGGTADDLAFARFAASQLRVDHREAPVSRDFFAQRWPEMVRALRLPLSTPNEVAINRVARAIRDSGAVVTLSGEGADELFAGYEGPITDALAFEQRRAAIAAAHNWPAPDWPAAAADFHLDANAWIPRAAKHAVLNPGPLAAAENDSALLDHYRDELAALAADAREPAQAHLGLQRRVNLAGLLLRLDQATMLESVESRTPFADVRVAALAQSLPFDAKFTPGRGPAGTKLVLRRAFVDAVPAEILARPKASFPLPFQEWCADHADELRTDAARELFTHDARAAVLAAPAAAWRLAWPMINLALWRRLAAA